MARATSKLIASLAAIMAFEVAGAGSAASADGLDRQLTAALHAASFTGRVEESLPQRLGRPVNRRLADLGLLLWFDKSGGLHSDNTCGGCHSPATGFGDSQSIAIGIQNNNLVGPHRDGPRNQRRTPAAVNTAFYPNLMWNGRFAALSGDPFDNSAGFSFPQPEGTTRFGPYDPVVTHLLIAQAHIPPTELVEVAGFTGTRGTIGLEFDQFDDGLGSVVPAPDASGYRNEPIRQAVLERLNSTPAYRQKFGALFPAVAAGAPIDFVMFGRAIAEFEFRLVFANAPIDRYARGEKAALQPAFFHNGAFTRLEDAIQHHLDVARSVRDYDPITAGLDNDLTLPIGPMAPVLARLDSLVATPLELRPDEFHDLVAFVRDGLLDERARKENLCKLVPRSVPSGFSLLQVERCPARERDQE